MQKKSEISIHESVRLTGFSRQKIYGAIADGKIKARKPNGFEIWVDRASLLAYAAARLAKTKAAK